MLGLYKAGLFPYSLVYYGWFICYAQKTRGQMSFGGFKTCCGVVWRRFGWEMYHLLQRIIAWRCLVYWRNCNFRWRQVLRRHLMLMRWFKSLSEWMDSVSMDEVPRRESSHCQRNHSTPSEFVLILKKMQHRQCQRGQWKNSNSTKTRNQWLGKGLRTKNDLPGVRHWQIVDLLHHKQLQKQQQCNGELKGCAPNPPSSLIHFRSLLLTGIRWLIYYGYYLHRLRYITLAFGKYD